jgi:hypothetical protein
MILLFVDITLTGFKALLFAGWLGSFHGVRWFPVGSPAKDLVQAMLPICLHKQLQSNWLGSKETGTSVTHTGISPVSADRDD